MKKSFLVAAAVGLFSLSSFASEDAAKQQQAIKKVEQAAATTNIFELPSFRMKADVQIESQGKWIDGKYQLLWNGPDQWREEIRFPGYTEEQVGGKGTVWIQRSGDFYPLRIFNLRSALGFGSAAGADGSFVWPNLTGKDKVQKIHARKAHGEAQTCVEYQNEFKSPLEICVNDNTNTLVRGSSYVDKDFQTVAGGKLFPRFLSFVEDSKTIAKVEVTEISTPVQFQPALFLPPAGASVAQEGCMNPAPPRMVKRVAPVFPGRAKQAHIEGTVALDVRIGADGVPTIGKTVGPADRDLEQSAITAVKDWRYEPATCSGKPVEVETIVTVKYWFQ